MDNNETPERDLPLKKAREFIDAMLNRLSDDDVETIWLEVDPDHSLSAFGKAEALSLVNYIVTYATVYVERSDLAPIRD